jgi:hypothetical protein
LALPGQQLGEDGTAYVDMQRQFGILLQLAARTYTVVWYGKTEPINNQLYGRYEDKNGLYPSSLVLSSEGTFDEDVVGGARSTTARGTWNIDSDGDVGFSKEFLKPSGLPLEKNETAKALNPRGSNFLQIEIAAGGASPIYQKKQILW